MPDQKSAQAPLVGIAGNGIVHSDKDNFDVRTRFQMVKDAGVFDYYEKTPPPGEAPDYMRASEETGIPLRAGSFYYTVGRDEPLLQWHLAMAREVGSVVQNMQIRTKKADGTLTSDDDVAETFLWAAEQGDRFGVTPAFEVHVNMWSEHYGRVEKVAEKVARRGAQFNITLDHSHVVFKIDNKPEQKIQDMDRDIESGALELDPDKPGNVVDRWLRANLIVHAHARASAPNNPRNIWARHPDGSFGRGIQYPFVRPGPGEWHSEWDEGRLAKWKTMTTKVLAHQFTGGGRLGHITTEFLPNVDYGGGAKFSIFENNIACARWLKETIRGLAVQHQRQAASA